MPDKEQFNAVVEEEEYVARRLTPTECARLQGFPDDWCSDVPHKDSAEYKLWGNGIALPCLLPMMKAMKDILTDIQNGTFVRNFVLENQSGNVFFKATRARNDAHKIEAVGEKLRSMMPWITKSRLVDKTRN